VVDPKAAESRFAASIEETFGAYLKKKKKKEERKKKKKKKMFGLI